MDALLVIDMQEDLLRGEMKHDLARVIARTNRLGRRVRESGGRVVFVQHDGQGEGGFEVVVAADCHTLAARAHLSAQAVIEHHHWIWANLICPSAVKITPAAAIRCGADSLPADDRRARAG